METTKADEPNQPAFMTASRALKLLNDILTWRNKLTVPTPAVRSVPTDTDGIRANNREKLPFGLGAVIDTTTSDGPTGTTTYEGVDAWLRFWNPWMAYWTNTPSTFRLHPGAFFRKALEESPELRHVEAWDPEDQEMWEDFTKELRIMHTRIGRLTGELPQTRTVCPRCKQGVIRQEWTKKGISEEGKCSNRECEVEIDYSADYDKPLSSDATLAQHEAAIRARQAADRRTQAEYRAALRDESLTNTWLTIREIKAVWPRIKADTLSKWVRRGHIRKRNGKYNLGDINGRRLNPPGTVTKP